MTKRTARKPPKLSRHRKLPSPKGRRSDADLRHQIRIIKRILKRLWGAYLRWKRADREAERALLRKLKSLQRALWKKGKK
jgi:hypothetical protein